MGNNTPDYDNLYFEPQPTWKDVVDLAEKYDFVKRHQLVNNKEFLISKDWKIRIYYVDDSISSISIGELVVKRPHHQTIKFLKSIFE